MHKGLVTTIIPVYNRSQLLCESVASVLAQSYHPIEIIIVDDGSTDDTPRVAGELAAAHAKIRTIRQQNSGPGAAREAGRQLARGEFIQYLDSDDLLMPDKFARQVAALVDNSHSDVAYGMTRYSHSNGTQEKQPWKRSGEKIEAMFPSFLQSRWWDTPNPLYRTSVCNKAGPWSTLRLEEDWEYDCRVAATGARLCYVPEYVCIVRDHDNHRLCRGGSDDPSRMRQRATAHQLIFQHAQQAGITHDVPEMQHFARELFLLSRQCGAAGLKGESIRLFELARTASLPEIGSGLQFRAYRVASSLLGWRTMGKLSAQLDKFRSNPA
jgi:glycosyltransferase involved in cell wall biosynthesis